MSGLRSDAVRWSFFAVRGSKSVTSRVLREAGIPQRDATAIWYGKRLPTAAEFAVIQELLGGLTVEQMNGHCAAQGDPNPALDSAEVDLRLRAALASVPEVPGWKMAQAEALGRALARQIWEHADDLEFVQKFTLNAEFTMRVGGSLWDREMLLLAARLALGDLAAVIGERVPVRDGFPLGDVMPAEAMIVTGDSEKP